VVRVNGSYWHLASAAEGKDESKRLALVAAGYAVFDLWDYDVMSAGSLDRNMRELVVAR
jgi:hypothetical protein